ncbi:MAG: sensor histidine kinase [Rhizobiaceae bacterium]|nr:sensor histidine kinase [Rhizobiaceae bacterium]
MRASGRDLLPIYCAFLAHVFLVIFTHSVFAQAVPRSVLILEESDAVRGQFYASIHAALRTRILTEMREPVSIYIENLDLVFFDGQTYEDGLHELLREKYRGRDIGVVVAIGAGALERALKWRADLWTDTPIVFAVVDSNQTQAQPHNTTGRTIRLSLGDMVSAANAVVPNLKRVVVLGEPFESQSATPFRQFASEIKALSPGLSVVDLTGMPMAELQEEVSRLPGDSAILYTPIYSDGSGAYFPAAEALQIIARAANRPIITPVETYIGLGAIGGYVLVPRIIGEEAADQVLGLLAGKDPATMPVMESASLKPVFDWTVMERWRADPSRLPVGSEIRNRPQPIWRQYPLQSAVIAIIVLMQSGFIAAVLYESRRRRRAEADAHARMIELAHVNRRATAGELSTALAHELNQPLGATLAHAESALIVLDTMSGNTSMMAEILSDIRNETLRASEIIVRLRRLLKKTPTELEKIDPDQLIEDVFKLVATQALEAGVQLLHIPSVEPLAIRGDNIQLQQVILNLVINAIESVRASNGKRIVVGRVARVDISTVEIVISDNGPGIAEDKLAAVFEPFFTTKADGMGMGLSIARTIVETHGGHLKAENKETVGAKFTLVLPLMSQ